MWVLVIQSVKVVEVQPHRIVIHALPMPLHLIQLQQVGFKTRTTLMSLVTRRMMPLTLPTHQETLTFTVPVTKDGVVSIARTGLVHVMIIVMDVLDQTKTTVFAAHKMLQEVQPARRSATVYVTLAGQVTIARNTAVSVTTDAKEALQTISSMVPQQIVKVLQTMTVSHVLTTLNVMVIMLV